MSITLLLVGLVRVALWATLLVLALRWRRGVLAAGAGLAMLNAGVFAVSNAGGSVPAPLFTLAAYLATPALALVVCATVIGMADNRVMRNVLARGR